MQESLGPLLANASEQIQILGCCCVCVTSFEHILTGNVPLVEFMYLVFTCMPGESYSRQFRNLVCLCDLLSSK